MRDKITRYQPITADIIDPESHGLTSRDLAMFVLGAVAARLISGLRTGMDDEAAERAAAAVLAESGGYGDRVLLNTFFKSRWSRLCDQVKSDRVINETGRPPVPHE